MTVDSTVLPGLHRGEERLGLPTASTWFGIHVGIVVDNVDPDGQARVRVRFPWLLDGDDAALENWCRLVSPMAGADRGVWFLPEVDDEVAVCFEAGDPSRPYVLGGLWNGVDAPPETAEEANDLRTITSRAGTKLTFDDADGEVTFRIETPGGNTFELADSGPTITVSDSGGNRIVLESGGITIESSGTLTISASTVDLSAGSVNVNSGFSNFSGVAKADTVISNSVVSSSYTPGAGNIW